MNTVFRARLVLLLGAIVAVAGLILWGVQSSLSNISQLEERFTNGYLDSFRRADDFENHLLRLNNSILRYAAWREPAMRNEFEDASTNLNSWIDRYDVRTNKTIQADSNDELRPKERQLFQKLNGAFDEYLRAAQAVRTNQPPAKLPAEAAAQFNEFECQSTNLLGLGIQLADAHHEAQQAFLDDVNHSLTILRASLFAGVVLLLLLVAVLGVVLYHDLIAPLRTKLVRSEELLLRQEKLATLGTLAAGIAHEIRNPLTSVKARLYTLGKHIQGNEAGVADAAIIANEITRLERIVQAVLQFARPSEPQLKAVHAHELLREVQTLMATTLEKDGVQLFVESGPELQVMMDSALIKQVLINLVRNAAEAIDGAGTVTLRARRDQVALLGQERAVAVLEVSDTGRGIPSEVEKRLFDPFFTTKEAGTGLGLSIAERVVEKHGGALQYQTQVGRGTTFGIVLPLTQISG
jgi:signal transduction histidine kinase